MGRHIRIEIKGKDHFWARAFHVEWQDQFPERELREDEAGFFLVDEEWLADAERVAGQTFCRIFRAPENPRRRAWFHSLIPNRDKKW